MMLHTKYQGSRLICLCRHQNLTLQQTSKAHYFQKIINFSISCQKVSFVFLILCLHVFYRLLIFFSKSTFSKNSSSKIESHTVWIQIRPNILLRLVCVQAVCKSCQQTTLVGKEFKENLSETYLLSSQILNFVGNSLIYTLTPIL